MSETNNEPGAENEPAAGETVTGDPRPWTADSEPAEGVQAPQNAEELNEAVQATHVTPSEASMTPEEQARREASLRDDASAEELGTQEVEGGNREPQE